MSYVIDQELCSGCHRCRVECPAQAIRFKNSKYFIDPDKCIECGHCVDVCHNDIITCPSMPQTAPVPHETKKMSCDVLVLGGGAAGMAAAAKAATLGKKVIVMEKGKEVGGSAWYAHVFRSAWSKWHEEAGCVDSRDKIYKQFMKKTQNHVDGKLFRRILDGNADFVNWLIEDHDLGKDFKFGDVFFGGKGLITTYDWDYNHKRIDTTIGPGGTGWFLCLKLLGIIEANGGEVLYETAATKLLTDDSGAVIGAIGKDAGGEVEVSCNACVVAAGAFTRNKELTSKFQKNFYNNEGNEPIHVFTCSRCTGDGITMCEEINADIDYQNCRVIMAGPMRHPFGTCSIAASHSVSSVNVNKSGITFDAPMIFSDVAPLANEPGRFLWNITDERAIEECMEMSKGRMPDVVGINMDRLYDNWREELDTELAWETMYKADTLEELAEKIHVPYENLKASVDNFNAHVHEPRPPMMFPGMDNADDDGNPGGFPMGPMPDPQPIENGPFYAIFVKMFHENAVGGMTIDENTNVLTCGKPITGLYAAGDNTRGIMLPGEVGVAYIENIISALTFAFTSGYVAGEEAAKFAK